SDVGVCVALSGRKSLNLDHETRGQTANLTCNTVERRLRSVIESRGVDLERDGLRGTWRVFVEVVEAILNGSYARVDGSNGLVGLCCRLLRAIGRGLRGGSSSAGLSRLRIRSRSCGTSIGNPLLGTLINGVN